MSPELIPILVAVATMGVALVALMVGLFARLRQDARWMEDRLAAVEHGQAKLEGSLGGLREAISGRRAVS